MRLCDSFYRFSIENGFSCMRWKTALCITRTLFRSFIRGQKTSTRPSWTCGSSKQQQQQQQCCNPPPMEVVSDVHLIIPIDVTFTEFVFQRSEQLGDRTALVGYFS
jgi:hypothetical protein